MGWCTLAGKAHAELDILSDRLADVRGARRVFLAHALAARRGAVRTRRRLASARTHDDARADFAARGAPLRVGIRRPRHASGHRQCDLDDRVADRGYLLDR